MTTPTPTTFHDCLESVRFGECQSKRYSPEALASPGRLGTLAIPGSPGKGQEQAGVSKDQKWPGEQLLGHPCPAEA